MLTSWHDLLWMSPGCPIIIQVVVLDEADMLSPATILLLEKARSKQWPWKFFLTTATLTKETLVRFQCEEAYVPLPKS